MKKVLAVTVGILLISGLAMSGSHGDRCGHDHGADECGLRENRKQECREECAKKECDLTVIGNELVCPVMGNNFTLTRETPKVEHEGRVYFFCCNSCVREFKANPEKYTAAKE